MKRGRPRRFNPSMPSHIDQQQLPAGAYWDTRDRVWYTHVNDGGKPRRKRLAGEAVTLADLHRLIEDLASTGLARGTIAWLQHAFAASAQWSALSAASQRDYTACLRTLQRIKTKLGGTVADLQVDRLRKVDLQQLVDKIAADRPAMANHVKRWLGRLFAWGMQRGHMRERENPAHGLDAARERAQAKMPDRAVMMRVVAFAQQRGAYTAHAVGSVSPYLWIFMVLAYRCRLRSIEVITLTDAHHLPEGIRATRRKGSRDNTTAWTPELHQAWQAATRYRKSAWERTKHPAPLRPQDRPLLVTEEGKSITSSALSSAWQRLMATAISSNVITEAERFTPHGLKHRGITDSADKASGGHVDPRMQARYDHEVPVVAPAGDHK